VTSRAYAITTGRAPRPRTRGLGGEPLRVVRAAGVGAVIGSPAPLPAPSARTLAAYHAVIQRLWQELPAVLPVRYGVALDEQELMGAMRARARAWSKQLQVVRGRAQMTVRVFDAGGQLREEAPHGPPASGTDYLRARASQAEGQHRSEILTQLRPAVCRWVRAERVERRGPIVTAYHLVPRRSATAYRAAILAASRRAHVRVHVTGPFAPYAFADEPSLAG
jgi:hypothetical protein